MPTGSLTHVCLSMNGRSSLQATEMSFYWYESLPTTTLHYSFHSPQLSTTAPGPCPYRSAWNMYTTNTNVFFYLLCAQQQTFMSANPWLTFSLRRPENIKEKSSSRCRKCSHLCLFRCAWCKRHNWSKKRTAITESAILVFWMGVDNHMTNLLLKLVPFACVNGGCQ